MECDFEMNKKIIASLERCWKPKGGMLSLDMEAAFNFVGTYEEEIKEAFEIKKSPWHSIESTPKDGTRILVYVPKKYSKKGVYHPEWKGARVIARWYVPTTDQISAHKFILSCLHEGYWTAHHKGTQPLQYRPTRWMPLPDAPEEK